MNGEEEIRLSKDEYEFRLHMVKFTGKVDQTLTELKDQNINQFKRIGVLEKAPRKMTAISSTIATAVSATVIGVIEVLRGAK